MELISSSVWPTGFASVLVGLHAIHPQNGSAAAAWKRAAPLVWVWSYPVKRTEIGTAGDRTQGMSGPSIMVVLLRTTLRGRSISSMLSPKAKRGNAFFVSDEGSVMVAAYNHILLTLFPQSELHICACHKLHGARGTFSKTGFEDLTELFASHAIVHAKKYGGKRRRWYAALAAAGKQRTLPPKVGDTRWCSWRNAADWWAEHLSSWKAFVDSEVSKSPWVAKSDKATPPLLHRIHGLLTKRLRSTQLRLAFISDHTTVPSSTLNSLQVRNTAVAPFVYD